LRLDAIGSSILAGRAGYFDFASCRTDSCVLEDPRGVIMLERSIRVDTRKLQGFEFLPRSPSGLMANARTLRTHSLLVRSSD
jgi:hypothetical protein